MVEQGATRPYLQNRFSSRCCPPHRRRIGGEVGGDQRQNGGPKCKFRGRLARRLSCSLRDPSCSCTPRRTSRLGRHTVDLGFGTALGAAFIMAELSMLGPLLT